MEIKKILVYTESYLPSIGGLENNTLLLCDSLNTLGYLVTLITPQEKATRSDKFKVVENSSLKVFFGAVKQNDFVVVNGGVSFKIILPSLIAQKPYVIIYQMATLFNDTRKNNIKSLILNKARKTMAYLAKKNIAVSEYSFLELQQVFGRKKSDLLTNPADPIFSRDTVSKKNFNLPFQCLFAGRLIEGKGIRLLIEAIHQINKYREIIHLHVVGDGPEKQHVIDQSILGTIFYHTPVSKEELKDHLSSMHLTIIPSTNHIEGSPLIMAESLVMGVPVLVSSQPAMATSIKNKYLIFESGNLQDLICKLNLLTNAERYERVKNYCAEIAPDYAFVRYVKKLKAIVDV